MYLQDFIIQELRELLIQKVENGFNASIQFDKYKKKYIYLIILFIGLLFIFVVYWFV